MGHINPNIGTSEVFDQPKQMLYGLIPWSSITSKPSLLCHVAIIHPFVRNKDKMGCLFLSATPPPRPDTNKIVYCMSALNGFVEIGASLCSF